MAGLTRKEIKEDRIRKVLTDLYQWLLVYQRPLLGALSALLVLVVVGWIWSGYSQTRTEEAQGAFSEALEIYHTPIQDAVEPKDGETPTPAPDGDNETFASIEERNSKALEAFREVSASYSGVHRDWARFYTAVILNAQGSQDEAQSIWEELSSDAPPLIRNLSMERLAELFEANGEYDRAIDRLQSLIDNPAENFPIQAALFKLARNQEAVGNSEDALDNYRRIVSEFPTSSQRADAEKKVKELELDAEQATEDDSGKDAPDS